ncbi:hypothetical protein ACWC4D_41585 [Streptomyces sp. NPDC001288]
MTDSPYGRGTCPVCHRSISLTKDGTLRHHSGPVGSDPNWRTRRAYRCEGAGQKPAGQPS